MCPCLVITINMMLINNDAGLRVASFKLDQRNTTHPYKG